MTAPSIVPFVPTLRPRYLGALLAVAAIGSALALTIGQETPVGALQGRVLTQEGRLPLKNARIVLTPSDDFDGQEPGDELPDRSDNIRRAVTDAQGNFHLAKLPAGSYSISASTRAHSVDDSLVFIQEGQTAESTLHLKRSQPELQIAQQQRVFTPQEKQFLPVRGYVDGSKDGAAESKLPQAAAASRARDVLQVRVFKTRLSDVMRADNAETLRQVGNRYEEDADAKGLPAALLHPKSGPSPHLVARRTVPITSGDAEGFFHQRIPVPQVGAGLYLIEVSHGKEVAASWTQVSKTGLIVKKANRQMVAYAVDLQSGKPQANTLVRVLRSGKSIASALTGASGLANFQVPRQEGDGGSDLMLVATRGNDEDAVQRSDYDYEEQGDYTVAAYTDRPIYRPGQTIFYKAIARRDPQNTRASYSIPANQPVEVELRAPNGDRVMKQNRTSNAWGAVSGQAQLSPEAATGSYTLVTSINGEEHTQDVSVAAYRKPEFAVTVVPAKPRYTKGDTIQATVAGEYYFGAPVAGATLKYEVFRATDWASQYPADYELDDLDESSIAGYGDEYGESVAQGSAQLDKDGKAVISLPAVVPTPKADDTSAETSTQDEPQAEIWTLHATVTDAAGREVESDGPIRVTSGNFRVFVEPNGYVARPGEAKSIVLTAQDYDGKPKPNVAISLQSGYWQEGKDGATTMKPVAKQRATTGVDGRAIINVVPPKEGELRLEATAQDDAGHEIRNTADLWASGDEGGDFGGGDYAGLSLLTDKRHYKPGETARVLLNAEHLGATALVSIEGEQVQKTWLVPIKKHSTVVPIPVLQSYGPNVFIAACMVRNKQFSQSETPLRVDVPQRNVTVSLHPDKTKHAPGDKITYQVETKDSAGKPIACDVSFGVVDESIYAIQKDDPKLLPDTFYPRRSNSVSTGFSFAVEYLGDADKAGGAIETRKKFPDTAFWQPDLQTNSQGRATVSFNLPDNLTTWRATALAQSAQTALGRGESKIIVAKDFFVRLETPRFLTDHDNSRLLALIHNETNAAQTATVKLEAEGVTLGSEGTQTVEVQPHQVATLTWPAQPEMSGLNYGGQAHLKLTAWTQNSPRLSDGLETMLPIRAHGRETVAAFAGQLTAQAPALQTLNLDAQAAPNATRLTVRLAPSIAGSMVGSLPYLTGFPYGCTEQTMSRFLPDLLVARTLKLSGARQKQLPAMVRDSVARLSRFQHASGGWGWWQNDGDDEWMTAYVLYGLSRARSAGYEINADLMQRGQNAGRELLKTMTDAKAKPQPSRENEPFLLYALALSGDTESAIKARPKLKLALLGPEALSYVVLLDELLDTPSTQAFDALQKQLVAGDDGRLHWVSDAHRFYNFDDGSDLMATALGLKALIARNAQDPRIGSILIWLMTHRTGDFWSSTRDTSLVLDALCDYLQARPGQTILSGAVRVKLNGKTLKTYTLSPDLATEPEWILSVPWAALRKGANQLVLERVGGQSPIFYSSELRQTIQADDLPALSQNGLSIKRELLRVSPQQSGNSWKLQTEPVNGALQSGDRLRVRLTIQAPRDMNHVLIEDFFPSGCELTERGDAGESSDDWNFWYSDVDARDDRIAFFARTMSKGKHTIEYNLRAQTPGDSRALPALVEEMYAPTVRGESGETRVEVR